MWFNFLQKIVKTIDPKLEKYREQKPKTTAKYTPTDLSDFIGVLQRTPKTILGPKDRDRIAAVMNFDNRHISDLMIPKSKMVFVHSNEILGPLVLDKLYKSGFTNFPVIDHNNKVLGIIHTEALNTLEIKKTDRATKYLDSTVYYLRTTDDLQHAVAEIERTNSYYFLIQDDQDQLAGFFTVQQLLDYLLN